MTTAPVLPDVPPLAGFTSRNRRKTINNSPLTGDPATDKCPRIRPVAAVVRCRSDYPLRHRDHCPLLPDVPPLAGFTVGVTAARRAEELGTMLERRGAVVLHGPAIRIVPLADDADLLAATKTLVARAAGHHGRHDRDRVPRLGRGRRGLGARGGPARRPGLGHADRPRPEGTRCDPGDGLERRVVAGVGVVGGGAGAPAGRRGRGQADRGAAARRAAAGRRRGADDGRVPRSWRCRSTAGSRPPTSGRWTA